MLISAAVRCFVMQRFVRMCYADATNRVLKEQSMVVRRTEKREFGLATGWSEEDGTTTTYQPFARNVGSHRRIETGPVPRNVQQRTAAPASLYARRPSGVQPKVATPALDEYEVLDLDELDLNGNPFAPRRSAASVSVWNVLGFAALFASVLVGRVILDAGQNHARGGVKEAPPPSAATAAGSAGVGPDRQRNTAAVDPDLAAREGSPVDANAAAAVGAKPGVSPDTAKTATPGIATSSATDALPSANTGSAQPAVPVESMTGAAKSSASSGSASSATPSSALPNTHRGSAADAQPTAADSSARARSGYASPARNSQTRDSSDGRDGPSTPSSDWRDGPMEPATTNAQVKASDSRAPIEPTATKPRPSSSDWRDGPMEPATTNAQVKASDSREPTEPTATKARPPSNDWRDGPMEPATTNARTPSNDWRDGPIEPATSSSAPPTASGKAAPGTLRINSRPWSQVFIDGRLIGNTPQMAVSVPAGRYTVRLANPELGMSKTIVVQVAAGELVTRIETLE